MASMDQRMLTSPSDRWGGWGGIIAGRGWRWGAMLFLKALLVLGCCFLSACKVRVTPTNHAFLQLLSVGGMISNYALAHDGQRPASQEELASFAAPDFEEECRYFINRETGERKRWLFFTPAANRTAANDHDLLMAAPFTDRLSGSLGVCRAVLYLDLRVAYLPEAEYQKSVKRQAEAR